MSFNSIFGYHFKNTRLLKEALSHPSLGQISYERLELLGDAVLGLVITELLMKKYIHEDEGKLAKRKSALISGDMLAQIGKAHDIGELIIMSEAERRFGGAENVHNIENVMEALIGAIYLDAGLEELKHIVTELWEPYIEEMKEVPQDPKSKLQEKLQKSGFGLPKYELIECEGPKHMLKFKISLKVGGYKAVIGEGTSKRQAEKNAALLLLAEMDKNL